MTNRISIAFVRKWVPPRKKTAHKGDAGRVLIIAGSRGMAGAAVLCAMGAVRSGAGLVRVAIVKSQQDVVVKRAPLEVTTLALAEDKSGQVAEKAWGALKANIAKYRPHVIAVGPGLGTGRGVRTLLKQILKTFHGGLVLDADALNVLSLSKTQKSFSSAAILTPHAGEMSRLLKWSVNKINADRTRAVVHAAKLFRSVCLLKGSPTLISDGHRCIRNTTGNPAMASGGMGDVLTGMIAALWAHSPIQNLESAWKAASAGAFLHGKAADVAVRQFPEKTLLASDVVAAFPRVFKNIFKRRNS